MKKLTATQILDHEEYFNPYYTFEGEEWSPLAKDNFSNYRQSNMFRVKNVRTNRILKISNKAKSKLFIVSMQDDDGRFKTVRVCTLFKGFDVVSYHSAEFLYNMF